MPIHHRAADSSTQVEGGGSCQPTSLAPIFLFAAQPQPLCVSLALLAFHPIHRYPQSPHSIQSVPLFLVHIHLTWASCSRSSSLVTVMERSQVYFLRNVSCSFCNCSSASRTSEKNWGSRKGHTRLTSPNPRQAKAKKPGTRDEVLETPKEDWQSGPHICQGLWGLFQGTAAEPQETEALWSSPGSRLCSLSSVLQCSNTAVASSSTGSARQPGRTVDDTVLRPHPDAISPITPTEAYKPCSRAPTSTVGRAGWSSRSSRSPVFWISLIFFSFISSSRIRA